MPWLTRRGRVVIRHYATPDGTARTSTAFVWLEAIEPDDLEAEAINLRTLDELDHAHRMKGWRPVPRGVI